LNKLTNLKKLNIGNLSFYYKYNFYNSIKVNNFYLINALSN